MTLNSDIHQRRSIRLKDYDYSQAGAYFVTICTHRKECSLGDIRDGNIELTAVGKIASKYWTEIPEHFIGAELDEFVVMPNHIHGIVMIKPVGVQNFEPLQHKYQHTISKSIGSIIRAYKSMVSHWCKSNGHDHFRWQRNYYEHVIRNEDDLNEIRKYIMNNPLKWDLDSENPSNSGHKALRPYGKNLRSC
jgi:REP element-mobilizing transposase RayT